MHKLREPRLAEWMILAVYKNGQEQLICVGNTEKEAMLHFPNQRDELLEDPWLNNNIEFFALRRWQYATRYSWGGWWKLVLTWRHTRRVA